MTSGVLVVDKPSGPTSHDVVAVARRALGERRIGHCGTLDPLATGVLVLALGQATRLARFLSSDEKVYEAVIRFGRTTATYDVTGPVTSTSADRPSREAVEDALKRFLGTTLQTPPAYSAKKVEGERSYDLVRRGGESPVLAPVSVTVHEAGLTGFDGETAAVRLHVSAGFYVRSLAHDLGQALGMGATLESLRRTRAGAFGLGHAIDLAALATLDRPHLGAHVVPLEQLLPEVPAVALTPDAVVAARRGLDVPAAGAVAPALARLIDDRGRLLGLARPGARAGFLHPFIVLN